MRNGFLIVSVGLLLVGALLYVVARSDEPSATALPATSPATSTPNATDQLSSELSEPASRVPGDPADLEEAPVVAPAVLPELHPEDDLFPLADASGGAPAGSIDPSRSKETEFFLRKYAGRTAKERLVAAEILFAFVREHEAGAEPKERALTEEEVQAMRLEIEWIKSNPGS